MIRRIKKPGLSAYIQYFLNHDPTDIWEIDIMGKKYKLTNGWKTGAKLFHENTLIAENNKKFHVNTKSPVITFNIKGSKVEIFAKAMLSVKINIKVNGQFIQNNYI